MCLQPEPWRPRNLPSSPVPAHPPIPTQRSWLLKYLNILLRWLPNRPCLELQPPECSVVPVPGSSSAFMRWRITTHP